MTNGAGLQSRLTAGFASRENIKIYDVVLVSIILFATFTHIWRLGEPERCYFDEVYFPTTGAEILRGDNKAWEFYGHENTHPPLSKVLMAAGMGVFGQKDYEGAASGNDCWGDEEDATRRANPAWLYDPFGFRFPGAVAGIGAVVFMYLVVRKLFQSEVAGLASAFLLSLDGLAFTQSRIATPDAYVLFFTLGCVYFLISHRWFLAGLFLGAAAASKWIGAFVVIPVILFFAWTSIVRWRRAGPDPRLKEAERVLLVGSGISVIGVGLMGAIYFIKDGLYKEVLIGGGAPLALGLFVILGGLLAIASDPDLRAIPRGRVYLRTAFSFPMFFIAAPFAVYMASYIPMFFNGHGLDHWWDLNRSAYEFHSGLKATHGYQSDFLDWPIDKRPVFLYLGSGYAKIYNLGNPMIFWMALPALGFVLWQAVQNVRIRIDAASRIAVKGQLNQRQAMLLFVVVSFLGLWLSLATQGRALFMYHYLPALAFAIMALGYVIQWLWYHPLTWARQIAVLYLAVVFVTAVYFYPHWAAVDVPAWLDETYYWFKSWR